jgi:hypothetical protein
MIGSEQTLATGSLATGYIGGGIPSLPTVTRLASNAPSGVLVSAGIKIFAFGFSSLIWRDLAGSGRYSMLPFSQL